MPEVSAHKVCFVIGFASHVAQLPKFGRSFSPYCTFHTASKSLLSFILSIYVNVELGVCLKSRKRKNGMRLMWDENSLREKLSHNISKLHPSTT